jgi:hypothetical protein
VNTHLAIHRMAFRESESLAVAQALVVQRRAELELKLTREHADVDTVLQEMAEARNRPAGRHLDRLA